MFRHTSLDPITVPIGGVDTVIDFVAETKTVNGVITPWTVEDRLVWPDAQQIAAYQAEDAALVSAYAALDSMRDALSAALSLADAYPYPTPEENAIIDNQVVAALTGYRALDDPPADVVALAAAVVSWRATT